MEKIMFLDGRHLKAARTMAAMSQDRLARAAGIHVNSVKRWEAVAESPLQGYAVERMRRALRMVGVVAATEENAGQPSAIVRFSHFRP